MRRQLAGIFIFLLLFSSAVYSEQTASVQVGRFAQLALNCIHQEYPNKISHVMSGDEDVAPPRQLTPVFFGCFDWHSSVHGHWLLVRLLHMNPEADFSDAVIAALERSFQSEKVAVEVKYALHEQRASFERPYGVAWLLQLMAELRDWDGPIAKHWLATLKPLETAYIRKTTQWLHKLAYPIRIGEHAQTAFAFALFLDWAKAAGNEGFYALVQSRTLEFYASDVDCPLDYEPGGQDFLSPCLAEADLMRRVMDRSDYAQWLSSFMPGIPVDGNARWLALAKITDRTDGKLAHLDGLHISRAWALNGMAAGLPKSDPRIRAILAAAKQHRDAGLAAVTGEHYEGGHWLGSFATYLVTGRGLRSSDASKDPGNQNLPSDQPALRLYFEPGQEG